MPAQISGGDVNSVLRLVRSLNGDGDAQLSIITLALVAGCLSVGVEKETALEIVAAHFDQPPNLFPLGTPETVGS